MQPRSINHKLVNFSVAPMGMSRLFIFILALVAPVNHVYATVVNETVTINQDLSIIIDLSASITNIANPVVTISSAATSGNTAIAVDCTLDNSRRCVLYTRAPDYAGVDTFSYSVVNDLGATETATVTVNVAGAIRTTNGLIPTIQVEDTLADICSGANLNSGTQAACDVIETTAVASDDRRILINEITPTDIAAQATIGNVLAEGQLKNIGKHLAALRKGQLLSATSGLVFNFGGKALTGQLLAELFSAESTGGAAGAANASKRWGWFINGNIGGGKQDTTEFENGFDFGVSSISTGIDYRLGRNGIIGVAIGTSQTGLDLDEDQGGLDAKGQSAIAYSSFYPSQESYIDLIVSGNFTSFDSERRFQFGGFDTRSLSQNDSFALAASIGMGYKLIQNKGLTGSVDLKIDYINTTIDGYTETGNSDFNMIIDERQTTQLTTTIGTSLTYVLSSATTVIVPQLDLFWVHQFEQDAEQMETAFAFQPAEKIFFDANTPDSDYFSLGLGVSVTTVTGMTSFVQLGSTISRQNYQNWQLALGVRLEL